MDRQGGLRGFDGGIVGYSDGWRQAEIVGSSDIFFSEAEERL